MLSNIFNDIPTAARSGYEETFEDLLRLPGLRLERIVSSGQASPPDFWYCQSQGEWVIVLQGAAGLQFAGETEARTLQAGDFINIPAGCRHRVAWTAPNELTVWLALFYDEPAVNPDIA